MRPSTRWLLTCLVAATGCHAQPVHRPDPLQGVWSVTEVQRPSAAGSVQAFQPQPGQFIFTRSRYSAVWVRQADARAPSARRWAPTADEKIADFQSLVAHSGTYEVSGSRVTLRPVVAKVPEFAGGYVTYEFRIEGDDLVLDVVDEQSGDGVAPPGSGTARQRLRLHRIE